jgi:hypothetical protein
LLAYGSKFLILTLLKVLIFHPFVALTFFLRVIFAFLRYQLGSNQRRNDFTFSFGEMRNVT